MAKYAGKDGSVQVAGGNVRIVEWNAEYEAKWLDASDTGSQGFQEGEFGFKRIDGTLKILVGDDVDPNAVPVGGAAVPVVLNFAPGVPWKSFNAKFDSVKPRLSHAGLIEADITFHSHGPIS